MRIEDDKIMISVTELDHVLDILDKVSSVNIELKEWSGEVI